MTAAGEHGRGSLPRGSHLLLASFLMLQVAAVSAAQWRISPRLFVSAEYTDNVLLSGIDQRDDLVLQFSPGISIRGEGGRISTAIEYNFQNLRYTNENELDSANHQLQADLNAELWRQVFFLEVNSRISQQLISNRGAVSSSNITSGRNRADVFTYSISPIVRHHFGTWAEAEARITRNEVFNSAQDFVAAGATPLSNSKSTRTSLSLRSGRRFGRLDWNLNFNRNKTENDSGLSTEFRSLQGQFTWALTRSWRLTALLGRDDNDFAFSRNGKTGGMRREFGFIWRPSRRTEVEARIGDRYFGNTFFLDARHQHRHWVFTARYNEETQTLNQLQSGIQLLQLQDAFGNPVTDPLAGANIQLPTDTPTLAEDTILRKRFDLGFDFQRQRNRLSLKLYNDLREFQARNTDERGVGVSLNYTRQLSPLSSGGITARITRNTFGLDESSEDRYYQARLFYRRNLGQHLVTSLEYNWQRRLSDRANGGYIENSAMALVNISY